MEKARKASNSSARGGGLASRGSRAGGLNLASAAFRLSAHDPKDLPAPGIREIAFAGRSNAGKSSAINALAGRKRLAFASKTPGRTQLINFFSVGDRFYLVDLPGYGYAGVPEAVRRHWRDLVGDYVRHRPSLAGVVIVMDARHPLTPLDYGLLEWLVPGRHGVHVLLTKADKLSTQAARATLIRVRAELSRLFPGSSAQLFSSMRRTGIEEAAATLASWVAAPDARRRPEITKAPA